MTKQQIVDYVSDATGLTKVETETVMNGIMGTIIDSLANNEKVELRGFGTFGIKHRMPKKHVTQELVNQFIYQKGLFLHLNLVNSCALELMI